MEMNVRVEEIRKEIYDLADEKYREFQIRLLPGTGNFVGVRLPRLREMAKKIAKYEGEEYLRIALCRNPEEELFEEIMLQGMIIGYMKTDISDIFSYTERFIPKIDNWSVCDSFCGGLKHTVQYPLQMWEWLQRYLHSDEEFAIRFGVVMLLNYYICDSYINDLFPIFDEIHHEGYYVKMAVAWAISLCYGKYPKETTEYLNNSRLDDFTYHKALQKITELRSAGKAEKDMMKKMRRMNL